MRGRLIIGIVYIIVGIILAMVGIILNRTEILGVPFCMVGMGLCIIAGYIHEKKQKRKEICWRNSAKKEMIKIPGTNILVNRKCCENCAYVEFNVIRSSQTINKICNYNPVRPIIGNHGHHVCDNWCPGAGCIVLKIEE